MNRVWKRFFRKLAEPVSFALYFFGTMLLAEYVGSFYGNMGFFIVWAVMVLVPFFAWMLKEIYRQAKQEVDIENQELLDAIKGK
jgi:hypothetical protein